jgi:hypothetical protein
VGSVQQTPFNQRRFAVDQDEHAVLLGEVESLRERVALLETQPRELREDLGPVLDELWRKRVIDEHIAERLAQGLPVGDC